MAADQQGSIEELDGADQLIHHRSKKGSAGSGRGIQQINSYIVGFRRVPLFLLGYEHSLSKLYEKQSVCSSYCIILETVFQLGLYSVIRNMNENELRFLGSWVWDKNEIENGIRSRSGLQWHGEPNGLITDNQNGMEREWSYNIIVF